MSRIGHRPLEIPAGVEVGVENRRVRAVGPKGELFLDLPEKISVAVEDHKALVSRADNSREAKSLHGLVRSLIRNMCQGVSEGFAKTLEIQGVGFNAEVRGDRLFLNLGFASAVEFPVPGDLSITVEGGTALTVSGVDNQRVGDMAARIRLLFPAEAYKGKGIRYRGEQVRRKVGKTVA